MIVRRTKKRGVPAAANALRSARERAGYRSGRAAAIAHGWVESTYRAHESATRSISPVDAKIYEKAFGCPEGFLAHPPSAKELKRELALRSLEASAAYEAAKDSKRLAGRRLQMARFLRGFPTADSAAEDFGFKRPTLAGHESGANAMSVRMAEMYGEAFVVNPVWLRDGKFPSGLGDKVDEQLRQRPLPKRPKEAEPYLGLVEKPDFPRPSRVAALLRDLTKTSSPETSSNDAVRELSRLALIDARMENESTSARRRGDHWWTLPNGLLSKFLGAKPGDVIVVVVDHAQGSFQVGDRLFVDTTKLDFDVPGRYAWMGETGGIEIRENRAVKQPSKIDTTLMLGKIIATFARN